MEWDDGLVLLLILILREDSVGDQRKLMKVMVRAHDYHVLLVGGGVTGLRTAILAPDPSDGPHDQPGSLLYF